jgi:hypothetical protein
LTRETASEHVVADANAAKHMQLDAQMTKIFRKFNHLMKVVLLGKDQFL